MIVILINPIFPIVKIIVYIYFSLNSCLVVYNTYLDGQKHRRNCIHKSEIQKVQNLWLR